MIQSHDFLDKVRGHRTILALANATHSEEVLPLELN